MSRIKYYIIKKKDPYKDEEYPVETTIEPTASDYIKGFFNRYFIQSKTDLSNIMEIDEKQYQSWEGQKGINSDLYNAVVMKWRIKGQAYDTYKGTTRVVPGVWDSNKRIADLKEQHIPGITKKLVDYIKFATIDRDVENPSGMTSFDEQHQHLYQVDSKGNGWALEAVNPRNPNIRHKHKIVNWEIQEAKSDCYPNCKMIYGHKGSGPHTHTINSTNEY